jgi:hypothetical protein
MSGEENKTKKHRELINSQTPTSFTDGYSVAGRGDGAVFLSLLSSSPEQVFENHRTIIMKEDLKDLIDTLCQCIDYYPIKKTILKEIREKKQVADKS